MRILLFPFLVAILFSCSKDDAPENQKYTLTTTVSPAGSGTVDPANGTYEEDVSVKITAIPEDGWEFIKWEGDLISLANPIMVTFVDNKNLQAVFEAMPVVDTIVVFSINDQHGQVNNFSKIKYIIDQEKADEDQVFFVCGGDMFSGNPIVDYHEKKGFPMIDLMNEAGVDVSVLGNHEFDYGQLVLNNRMDQAEFEFVCANVDQGEGGLNDPKEFVTIEKGGVRITFLGLIETSSNGDIPLTHPKKVTGLTFYDAYDVIGDYADLEATENPDLLVVVSHCGFSKDRNLALTNSFIDLIIGGHSHSGDFEMVNGVPIAHAGSKLNYLNKLTIVLEEGAIKTINRELIDLNSYGNEDAGITSKIDDYNNQPGFFVTIGFSNNDHSGSETGCFYVDALRGFTGSDVVFQNSGGVRSSIDYGDITPFEIYSVDPFGNGLDTYQMTVGELKTFIMTTRDAYYYSGVDISLSGADLIFKDGAGNVLSDDTGLEVSLNDYITSVYPDLFPEPVKTYGLTTAEAIIEYLTTLSDSVDYDYCSHWIQY